MEVKTLRQWRREREMTQTEVAVKIGIHPNTYKKYEKCPGECRIKTLIAICNLFDIGINQVKIFLGTKSRELFKENDEGEE